MELFFIEGVLMMAIAAIAIFILPDFPENSSSWLSLAEQALAIRRMQEDATLLSHYGNIGDGVVYRCTTPVRSRDHTRR